MRGWFTATLAALAVAGCASPPAADDDCAGVQDDDDDTTEPCDGITWGAASAFTVGEPVGNWALHGYVDEDGDGAVDRIETPFTLQDIQCRGHEALLIVVGDTT